MAAVSAVLSGEAKFRSRCSRILQLASAASLAIETPELDDKQRSVTAPNRDLLAAKGERILRPNMLLKLPCQSI
jgi:hypothetical protein